AEETAKRLAGEFRQTFGEDSVYGLAAGVQHGKILMHLGRQMDSRRVLEPVAAEIRQRLGPRHPPYLSPPFSLGPTYPQPNDNRTAAAILGETWQVQREVHGPAHPDTLQTQFHYGITLKFFDWQRSTEVLDDARRRLPKEIGWKNDLVGKMRVEQVLRPVT